jgi:hypothetical protein
MKKDIEKFIRENRNAFDDKEPSEKIWKNIENSLRLSKPSVWNHVGIWRAAAVVFMILSGYLMIPKNQLVPQNDAAMKEFSETESFYIKQISEKVELIGEFERNEGLNGFTHDFQQLEAMYNVLKEEMKNRPSQKVKDALVLNLLVRIDLLNQQLHKLDGEYKPSKEEVKPKANT